MSSIQNYAVLLLVGGCLFGAESAPAKSIPHRLKVPRFARNEPAPELYSTLANYYHARQLEFKLRAKNEHHEWVRRSEFFASPLLKYPEPEISSRYRYEYFAYEAQEMNRLAEHYEQLAMQATEDPAGMRSTTK